MTLLRPALAAALAALVLAGPAFAADEAMPLKLDAATQKRIGVATAPLAAARRASEVSGFARVLDPVPLATLASDLGAAEATAAASAAEAARTQALLAADATVSAKMAEAAQAQARSDAVKAALLRQRLGLEWGPSFMRLTPAARERLIGALASGQSALVRIDVSGQTPAGVRGVDIDLGGGATARAIVLGPARTGDPRLQSTGLLAQVSGPAAARLGSGMTAPVRLPTGPGVLGVILPRSALLRADGQTLVYIRRPDGAFEPRTVSDEIIQPDGLFATHGFTPGEAVVIQGGQALFAAQHPPAAGDE